MSSSLSMARPLLAVAVVTLAVMMTVEGAPSYAKSRGRMNAVARRQQAAPAPLPLVQSPSRNLFGDHDPRRYLPVDHTDDVKRARNEFFNKYEEQVKLIEETRDAMEDEDAYYYGDSDDYEDDDDDDEDEEGSEDEDEGDEEDDDDDEEESEESDDDSDSDYGESDSSSSESDEDYGGSSSDEDGESSEESSEESSSSSSSEEETNGGLGQHYFRAPKPVKDTPEVEQAKRRFLKLYKERAELAFNAPDY